MVTLDDLKARLAGGEGSPDLAGIRARLNNRRPKTFPTAGPSALEELSGYLETPQVPESPAQGLPKGAGAEILPLRDIDMVPAPQGASVSPGAGPTGKPDPREVRADMQRLRELRTGTPGSEEYKAELNRVLEKYGGAKSFARAVASSKAPPPDAIEDEEPAGPQTVLGPQTTLGRYPGAAKAPQYFRPLSPDEERRFREDYAKYAARTGNNPNPDDPRHKYNYRAWWRAMQDSPEEFSPQVDPQDGRLHGPSLFKAEDHPNRFVTENGRRIDTINDTGDPGQSLTRSTLHGVVRGAAESAAGIPEAIGIQAGAANRWILEQYDKIDRGEKPSIGPSAGSLDIVIRYFNAPPEERRRLRAQVESESRPIFDEPAFQFGTSIREGAAERFPIPTEHESRFPVQLGRGVGSTAVFLGTGVAGKLLRLPALAVTAGTGAMVNGSQTFREAVNKGASIEDALQASRLSALVGTSEALPIARILDRIDSASGGQIRRLIVNGLKGGLEEGAQEAFQSIADNLIASKIVKFDPERQVFEGTGENAGVGFTVGALFNVLSGMLGVRVRAQPQGAAERLEPRLVPQDTPEATEPADTVQESPRQPAETSGVDVQEPSAPNLDEIRSRVTRSPEVVTPRGRRVRVENEVVELGDLIASHRDDFSENPDFPKDLQPRDRSRAASQAQVNEIAANLEPTLLGPSASATDGAPIVGPDNVIESGNARTLALRRVYANNPEAAERYRSFLKSLGYEIEGMTAPVLVRRRRSVLSAQDRQAFTREANERSTLGMSATEQALADAGTMPNNLLDQYRGGGIEAAANREFVRRFASSTVSSTDQATMFTPDGQLSQQGRERIENAIFARAYDDSRLLESLREGMDSNIRGIGNALIDAAPRWAQMRSEASRRIIKPELDITANVIEAARIVSEARRSNLPVADIISQGDIFSGGISENTRAVLGVMFRDSRLMKPRDWRRIAQVLGRYAEQAMESDAAPGLIDLPPIKPADLLETALSGGQGDLVGNALPETAFSETRHSGPGARFTGFVPDRIEGRVFKNTKRREDILRPLLKSLGVPLYQGRIKSKKFLGFYRRGIEEVRIKNMNDLEVSAHELAHMLDDRFPEIRQQWLPSSNKNRDVRAELKGVSYDKDKLFEGFAEFVRLWATQKEEAQAKAPKFFDWFESFLNRNPHGQALRKAQAEMHEWFSQSGLERAKSKIGVAKGINDGLTSPWDDFRQSVFDDLHGIYRMERELSQGNISPLGAYETARLVRARSSIVEGALLYGAPVVNKDGSHSFKGKGLRDILSPVSERLNDFLMYAVGRSSSELMAQGREHLFSKAEIQGMLSLENETFNTAFDEYQAWNKAILDFAQSKGVINPVVRQMWRRTQYLPFHRVGQPGHFASVPGDWKGIKALTGGTDNLRDILGNMIGNASMLIDAALTNEARLEVAKLAGGPKGAHFMARIPTDDKIVKVRDAEIERAILDALGVKDKRALDIEQQKVIDEIMAGMGGFVPLVQRGQAPKGNNVVAVLDSGKPVYYEVADPLLYRALTSLNRPVRNWLTRILGVPKRLGQLSITFTADFIGANIARDTLMGSIMSRHGFRPFLDSVKGMKSRIATDQNYKDFIANGGGFASYLVDEDAFKHNLRRFYTKRGIAYRTVIDTPAKILYSLEKITDAFEMATRLGEFERARKKGEHPRHAAFSAREVSTDFAMRGDSAAIGFMYDTIIFLKAAMNGMDRLYRGVAHDPNKMQIAGKTAILAMLSAGLYLLNRGNPDYEDLEDWDRDTSWHLYVPTPEALQAYYEGRELPPQSERYLHFRYPKIWEIGAVATLAERTIGRFLDDQPEEVAGDLWRVLTDLFRFEYIPQAFAPPFELAINRNRFTDRPIETQAQQEMQPFARSGPGTSRTIRALGEATRNLDPAFQVSPEQVESLLRGYLNTWALYGLTFSDALFFDDAPSLRVDQYPVIRRFYQESPPRHSKYVTQFYDAVSEATAARRTMRHMAKTFRPEFASDLEHTRANLEYNQLTRAEKTMQSISAEMRRVSDSPDLDTLHAYAEGLAKREAFRDRMIALRRSKSWDDLGDMKRDLLDMWMQERNEFAKRVMLQIESRRGE